MAFEQSHKEIINRFKTRKTREESQPCYYHYDKWHAKCVLLVIFMQTKKTQNRMYTVQDKRLHNLNYANIAFTEILLVFPIVFFALKVLSDEFINLSENICYHNPFCKASLNYQNNCFQTIHELSGMLSLFSHTLWQDQVFF